MTLALRSPAAGFPNGVLAKAWAELTTNLHHLIPQAFVQHPLSSRSLPLQQLSTLRPDGLPLEVPGYLLCSIVLLAFGCAGDASTGFS
jgi:hypothetical protein